MMSVPSISSVPPVQTSGRAAASSEEFRLEFAASGLAANALSVTAGREAAAVAGLLALDEAEEKAARDRRARRRGEQVLAALSRFQRGLLGQAGQSGTLDELRALLADMPKASDRGLALTLGGIACRARVVIALHAARDSPE
jgi:hypothetical protein